MSLETMSGTILFELIASLLSPPSIPLTIITLVALTFENVLGIPKIILSVFLSGFWIVKFSLRGVVSPAMRLWGVKLGCEEGVFMTLERC